MEKPVVWCVYSPSCPQEGSFMPQLTEFCGYLPWLSLVSDYVGLNRLSKKLLNFCGRNHNEQGKVHHIPTSSSVLLSGYTTASLIQILKSHIFPDIPHKFCPFLIVVLLCQVSLQCLVH